MQIDTIRPDSLESASGWTATPSGTLYGVTSDNSDSTYALWSGTGSAMLLGLADHALPTDHQRHLVRARVRGQSADVGWSIRLPSGTLIAPGTATFTSADTVAGSWGTGIEPLGAADIAIQVQGQLTNSRVLELYVDIDSRLAPTFTPQVLDNGTPTTTVVGTNAPDVRASSVDLDGLPPRQYRYWVTSGLTVVWDTGIVSGPAVSRTVDALENGSYTVHMEVWSTLGASTEYASDIEELAFTISTTSTLPPVSADVEVVTEPFYDISVCAPTGMAVWDGDEAYVEIQRTDCDGTQTRVALAGPIGASECVTYREWTAPRSLPANCFDGADTCEFSWRVRFLGRINDLINASSWVDVTGDPPPPAECLYPGEEIFPSVTLFPGCGVTVTGSAGEFTLEWEDGEHLVRAITPDGAVYVSACGELRWDVDKPFTVNQGVEGGRQVYLGAPGGHNISLTLTVRTEQALQDALQVFDGPLVLISPADSVETWASPVGTSINVIKIGRLRQLVVPMIATGPEPQPEVD